MRLESLPMKNQVPPPRGQRNKPGNFWRSLIVIRCAGKFYRKKIQFFTARIWWSGHNYLYLSINKNNKITMETTKEFKAIQYLMNQITDKQKHVEYLKSSEPYAFTETHIEDYKNEIRQLVSIVEIIGNK
jgi:hypothetical protein